MNVVSVMAHQDDEMRCLGTMLKCKERGDQLTFVTLTDGSKGFVQQPDIEEAQAAAIRDGEMRALATKVGADYINLGHPDEFLYDTPEVRMDLIEALRKTDADLVFTHFYEDYNADHVVTHNLVRHCAMQACLPVLPSKSRPLGEHPAVFLVEPFGAFSFNPTHYVDISELYERKLSLLAEHASQEAALSSALGHGFEGICGVSDAFRGQLVGCAYAEAFVPMAARGAVKPYGVLP